MKEDQAIVLGLAALAVWMISKAGKRTTTSTASTGRSSGGSVWDNPSLQVSRPEDIWGYTPAQVSRQPTSGESPYKWPDVLDA